MIARYVGAFFAFTFIAIGAQSQEALLQQEPRVGMPTENQPDFPPSYTVHILPSKLENGMGNFGGDSWQSFQGYELRAIISELYSITPIRIELPASLEDGRRYDFSLVLPQAESRERMYERFRLAVQDYFHLTATRQSRMMDVYVVTAPSDQWR
jgi:hypothetical protein